MGTVYDFTASTLDGREKPFSDFAGQVLGNAFVGLAAHEAQGILDFGIGKEVEVGRLFELYGESLL